MAERKAIPWFRIAQVLAIPLIGLFLWRQLAPDWSHIVDAFASVRPRWGLLALASVVMLSAHMVLIETWRRVVMAWGERLSFVDAARIWCISNLAKWAPGRIWQVTVMGTMAHRSGVSPVAAVGSSLLNAAINVLAAFAVVMLTASDAVPLPRPIIVTVGVLAVAVGLLPRFLPAVAKFGGRLLRRDITWPAFPYSTTVIAYAGFAIAWCIYGVAFQMFAAAMLGEAAGATHSYIAVYTTSYIAGYLFLPAPGGLGVREASLIKLLQQFGLATLAAATVVAFTSRLWLVVLELLPGLIFLIASKPSAVERNDT